MIYFRNKSNQNRKILKWLKSKSKSLKNDLNRDLNHIRFKSPMILTTLLNLKYNFHWNITITLVYLAKHYYGPY